jgi:hypothetical protein
MQDLSLKICNASAICFKVGEHRTSRPNQLLKIEMFADFPATNRFPK